MTDLERAPVLRVMPGPGDINANGHIFGGWVLSQMDIAAGIVASRRARGPVATVAIEAMKFIAPIHLRDLISVYARCRAGRPHLDGGQDRGDCRSATWARPRSRSPKVCSPSSRSMRATSRGRVDPE